MHTQMIIKKQQMNRILIADESDDEDYQPDNVEMNQGLIVLLWFEPVFL